MRRDVALSDAPSGASCVSGSSKDSMGAMSWGEVELEDEVRSWYLERDEDDQARIRFHIDRLAEYGPLLDEPFTRQLQGPVRELRFMLHGRNIRITYWIATGRRIVLLTVFAKTQRREPREIARAMRAYQRCIEEKHLEQDPS